MKKHFMLICVLLLFNSLALAESLIVENGRLEYNGSVLSDFEDITEAQLHPSGDWIYFTREDVNDEKKFVFYELWRINIEDGTKEKLYRNEFSPIDGLDGYNSAYINNIQFSRNGDKIYFEAAKWVTSAALYVMDPSGDNLQMLGGGNNTKIIASARGHDDRDLSDYIVTNQHRYGYFGGAYDWYWLYTPEWEEVGALGSDWVYFTQIGDIKYTDNSHNEITDDLGQVHSPQKGTRLKPALAP